MKKKLLIIVCIGLWAVMAVILILSLYYVPIELPGADIVTRIQMEDINEITERGIVTINNQSDIEKLLTLLSGAKKIRSIDFPAPTDILLITIFNRPDRTNLFLYAEGNAEYVHVHYGGKYKLDRGRLKEIYQLYTSLVAASFESDGDIPGGGITVGNIKIMSGGVEYSPLTNWIYSLENGLFADGARKYPKDVTDELSSIPISDDFEITIDGETTEAYTLYNDEYEEVYYRESAYTAPSEQGEYILCIEASWGNEKQYAGYQYFFKLIK